MSLKKEKLIINPPSVDEFIKAFKNQKALGYEKVVCLLTSNELINSYHNANLAKTILNDEEIYIIDSKTFGPGVSSLINKLNQYVQANLKFNNILKLLAEDIKEGMLIVSSDSTEHLPNVKGLKTSIVESMLPVYYLLTYDNHFNVIKQSYGTNFIYKYLKKIIINHIDSGLKPNITIFHTGNSLNMKRFLENLNKNYQINIYDEISFVVGHMFGPNSIGFYISN